ncbi:MAG: hypothetical protein KDB71_04840 [Mycobacterium sp.]|nr:hypothetical protein [Mycobacterium sp.]
MGLFSKRKSRATKRAEARALKARAKVEAKMEAKLAAKNEAKRIKAAERSENKAIRAELKAKRNSDRTAVRVAETQLRTAREGKVLSPSRIRRTMTASRLLAPVLVPVVYRAAMAARGVIDERRAERLGVPVTRLGQFSGEGGRLSARISSAEHSLELITSNNAKPGHQDAETKKFVAAMTDRLAALSAGVTAAENLPGPRRRAAHISIGEQLDGIEADLMARLGVF